MNRFLRVAAATVAATAMLAWVAPAGAAQGPGLEELEARISRGPTVSDLVAYAYQTNPSIRAAREQWRAVLGQYRVATGYPDPQLMGTWFPEPIETRLGPQDWSVTLTQGIPFPGKLGKAGDVVAADARIAHLELDRAVRDVVVAVRESYHELLYIRQARRVVAENRELLDELRKIAETAHGREFTTFADVAKAQSQLAQVEYDAILLDELRETERAQMNALLNRAPEAEIGPLAALPVREVAYDLEAIYELARANRDEVEIAAARVERARAETERARYENYPDFKVGAFYAAIGDPDVPKDPPDAGRDALGIQFGLELPIWFGKNAGRVERARAQEDRSRALRTQAVNDTLAGVRSTYFRLRNARRLVALYAEELLPQAARSMEVAETWFREGEGSFSDFVETEAVFYNFQLSLARARADFGKYLARLERLAGVPLAEARSGEGAGSQAVTPAKEETP